MGLIRAILRLPLWFWFLIVGGALYFNYMTWQSDTLVKLQDQVTSGRNQLTRIQRENREAENFEKDRDAKFQELQAKAEEFNKALEKLPKSSDTPGLLSNLAEISDRVGVEFTRFEPGRPELNGFLMETPFKVELRGSFVQVMSFLDEVAHLKRIVSGKTLSLRDPTLRGQTAQLRAEAVLVTYYFDENAKATAQNSPNRSAQAAPPAPGVRTANPPATPTNEPAPAPTPANESGK